MGLSIKIYQNYTKTEDEDNYDFEACVVTEEWNDRIKNLVIGGLYKAEKMTRTISYSYSYHNDFRRLLCEMLGYEKDEWLGEKSKINSETPFFEFFEFADNEGCMDFETSRELHKDFLIHHTKFIEMYKDLGDYVLDQYDLWLETFELGKENGVVVYG
jgi:hypothetical protein